jgi:hypothetical protein
LSLLMSPLLSCLVPSIFLFSPVFSYLFAFVLCPLC